MGRGDEELLGRHRAATATRPQGIMAWPRMEPGPVAAETTVCSGLGGWAIRFPTSLGGERDAVQQSRLNSGFSQSGAGMLLYDKALVYPE